MVRLYFEKLRYDLKTGGADAVDAFFIFLNLLKRYAKNLAKLLLGDRQCFAALFDALAQFNVFAI